MKIVDEVKVFMRDPSSFAPLLLCHDRRHRQSTTSSSSSSTPGGNVIRTTEHRWDDPTNTASIEANTKSTDEDFAFVHFVAPRTCDVIGEERSRLITTRKKA